MQMELQHHKDVGCCGQQQWQQQQHRHVAGAVLSEAHDEEGEKDGREVRDCCPTGLSQDSSQSSCESACFPMESVHAPVRMDSALEYDLSDVDECSSDVGTPDPSALCIATPVGEKKGSASAAAAAAAAAAKQGVEVVIADARQRSVQDTASIRWPLHTQTPGSPSAPPLIPSAPPAVQRVQWLDGSTSSVPPPNRQFCKQPPSPPAAAPAVAAAARRASAVPKVQWIDCSASSRRHHRPQYHQW
jgi:Mrp family chromosome partitioning ATPase